MIERPATTTPLRRWCRRDYCSDMKSSTAPLRASKQPLLIAAAFLLFTMMTPPAVHAHAELILQIEMMNKEIEKSPNDPDLYLRRGQLRREHLEFDEAYADFERAVKLSPDLRVIDLYRGRLFLDSSWPLSARVVLDRFLARNPKHMDALVLRAKALTQLNLRLAAVQDYTSAIASSPEPGPDLFIERAQLLEAEGPQHLDEALAGLDEGIEKIGPLVTLQLFAINAEVKRKNYDGAVARLDKVAERSPRKETWLARRAEVLTEAGRTAEAQQSYQAALQALHRLPPARRNVPAMAELESRIRTALGQPPETSKK